MQSLTTCQMMSTQTPRSCSLPSQLPQFYYSSQGHKVWDIPAASLGQLCWLCARPAPGAPPASLLAGQYQWVAAKSLAMCEHSSATAKLSCVIRIIFLLHPQHVTGPANMKAIISFKTWTASYVYLLVYIELPRIKLKYDPQCFFNKGYSTTKRKEGSQWK